MCKKQGKSVYKEFMNLIAKYQYDIIQSEANFIEEIPCNFIQCNFCGKDCKGEIGLKQHEKFCPEKPKP